MYDDYLAFIKAVRLYCQLEWVASQRSEVLWTKLRMWTWNEEIYHEMLSPYKGGTVYPKDPKVDLKNGIYHTYLDFIMI